jgi:ferredoxin-NADP reductase
VANGIVTCPWHGWAFRSDDGRSADGNGCSLRTYPVKVEDGRILVAWPPAAVLVPPPGKDESAVSLRVVEVVAETPDTRTIRLDNSGRLVAVHKPGQHIKVGVQGPSGPAWRSFTISSPPTRPDVLEVTVKRNPSGIVSPAIHSLLPGMELLVRGPQGGFVFDPDSYREPLVLAAAGSGVTPAMSILRTIHDLQLDLPVTLLYGCRTLDDIIFARELEAMRLRLARFRMILTLSQPDPEWSGSVGRVTPALVARHIPEPAAARHFLCGPGDFVDRLSGWLRENGVVPERIHSERFGKSSRIPAGGGTTPDAFALGVTESPLAAR